MIQPARSRPHVKILKSFTKFVGPDVVLLSLEGLEEELWQWLQESRTDLDPRVEV